MLVGLGVLAILVTAVVLQQRAEGRRVRAEIQKRLDAIRAAGEPLTAQDLAKLYPDPPPERDARRMLKDGLAKLVVPDTGEFPLFHGAASPAHSAPLSEADLAEAQRWLASNQVALAAIPWDQLPGSWIGSGFTNDLLLTLEPPQRIMSLVQLLCLDAIVRAEQREPKSTVEALRRALAVGNAFRNDLLVHFMFRGASQMSVSQTLERVLSRESISDVDLSLLQTNLTFTNVEATREYWADLERCRGLFLVEMLRTDTQPPASGANALVRSLVNAYRSRLRYRDNDLPDYLDWCDRCLRALSMPVSNAMPAIAAIDREADAEAHRRVAFLSAFRRHGSEFYSVSRLQLLGFFEKEVRCVATVRTARAALAIERWRLAHDGRLPDSLAALVPDFLPAVPTDPYDDQPMRYKKLAVGYVVYSVGSDFADDGGKEKLANPKDGEHYDITFTVER